MSSNFLAIGKKFADFKKSKAVVLKIPYEATTSYMSGCKFGPDAIVDSSAYVELFDEEYKVKPHTVGITTREVSGFTDDHDKNLKLIGREFVKYYKDDKFVVALGGEHSITIGIIDKLAKKNKNFSVIQFDAHADLRSYYQKSRNSHACAMRRVIEKVPNTFQVGLSSISQPENSFMLKNKLNILWAREMEEMSTDTILNEIFEKITTDDIYITFDVDYFPLDIVRSTGTPEPGGPGWYKTLNILEGLFKRYNVIGADVVELIGDTEDAPSLFATALLVKKLLVYKFFAKD